MRHLRFVALSVAALLAIGPTARAGWDSAPVIPVRVGNDGVLRSAVARWDDQLGPAFWFWEGGASRAYVETFGPGNCYVKVQWHLDVGSTPYWLDLTVWQSPAGVDVVGSHSGNFWPDVCEAYASWADLLRHRNDQHPLAIIAVDCLRRCGMTERWEAQSHDESPSLHAGRIAGGGGVPAGAGGDPAAGAVAGPPAGAGGDVHEPPADAGDGPDDVRE